MRTSLCRAGLLAVLAVTAAGCSGGDDGEPPLPAAPTFSADVAPILHAHCAECHRPDGAAPFSLLTYDDAHHRANLIAAAARKRRMPPWLPQPSDFPFADERRLTPREIAILERWAEQGAPPGNAARAPAPPGYTADWALGPPDLVLELPASYTLAPGTGDVFRNFVLPNPLQDMRYVRAVELRPGSSQVAHHAVIAVDPTATSRQEDAEDPQPGFDGMFARRAARPPGGFFVGWTPGRVPRPNPEGLAWTLEPGTDLVIQMHLRPHAHAAAVRPRVALYFADTPPARTAVLLRLGSQTLDIPPGARNYAVTDSMRLPVAVELFALYPHAHYLGKTMVVRALLPEGATRHLLRIDDWDFNWQDAYAFARPVPLPPGTLIHLRYVYDNSGDNPRNPSRPPRRVVFGPSSSDEMAELWLQAVPRSESDLSTLQRAVARKAAHDYVEGWQHLIRLNPRDAVAHANLAAFHGSAGDRERAIEHYRRAVEAEPDYASAHYNLGILLEQRGDSNAAVRHYRHALRARPHHAGAHNNLGNLLLARGQRDEAAAHFQRAIALEPGAAEAHNNLGRLLWESGRAEQAIDHYRQAVRLRPTATAPHLNLAFALASLGQTLEAVEHFEHAARLAAAAGEAELAARIRQRMQLYLQTRR